MTMSGIYRIQDKEGRIYIGSAVNLHKRIYEHRRRLKAGNHINPKLQNAWNKYGESYFTFSIVEIVEDKTKLTYYEQIWIDILFQSLDKEDVYNIAITANSQLGHKWTDEQKHKHTPHLTALAKAKAKTYKIYDNSGNEVVFTNLEQFCRDNNLKVRSLRRMLSGERHSYKGYTK